MIRLPAEHRERDIVDLDPDIEQEQEDDVVSDDMINREIDPDDPTVDEDGEEPESEIDSQTERT